ncbi:TetR/AcrR family transcriptional regulator [Streptomyces sp. AC495_CC817]|uniref:TetR/AcrR family transcriptional regulator n=1 Tax=Streptomyces sp. AC495_CC817 TaxID=2823900 RepID=UPI001C275A75|nr:TetR/AcrR family transcriptional regulator [Streptomyces sp. AC495_CC817]
MTTSARQTRAAATRQRILAAARELFVAQGYRSTSLRDIAAAASVSHPGLLGHFASKDDLLAEVVAEFEQENADAFAETAAAAEPGALIFAELAARNARTPGYLELFAALTGEASAPAHPAHERMRERYAQMHELSVDALQESVIHGVIAPDRDLDGESIRHTAAWDGLQLLSQYLPDRVDVVTMLEERESLWAMPFGWRDPEEVGACSDQPAPLPTAFPTLWADAAADAGYAVGRKRRAQILADAMHLFSRSGYGDTSLRDIAEAVGVSKSTLLHHYGSKEMLLSAVLSERDRAIQATLDTAGLSTAAEALRAIPEGARHSAVDEPGLIEVYAVLSCEAVPEAHPAHDYFARRFTEGIDYFAELFRRAQVEGALPAHRDPEHEAVWLIALWDGLQYQWLYDRDAVDTGDQLRAHLADVLPGAEPRAGGDQFAATTASTPSP